MDSVWLDFLIIYLMTIMYVNCRIVSANYNYNSAHPNKLSNNRISSKSLLQLNANAMELQEISQMNSNNNYSETNTEQIEIPQNRTQFYNNFSETVLRKRNQKLKNKNKFNYDSEYHSYGKIISELKSLNDKKYGFVRVVSIGQSTERRLILGVILSKNNKNNKRIIVLECGVHAREWVSTASCLWIINRLIHENSLLGLYEIIIIPLLNPDGYAFSWNNNRMWRKSRSKAEKSKCFGVDLNRNWDSNWCVNGSSKNPCSEIYCGKSAFSEPETKSLSAFLLKRKKKIAAYFAVHSFSQLWFYPLEEFNHSSKHENFIEHLSKNATDSMYKVHHKIYEYGSIANMFKYPISGHSIDWVYDKLGVKLSFGIELRDNGHYGFRLPPKYVKPTAEELFEGIKSVVLGI